MVDDNQKIKYILPAILFNLIITMKTITITLDQNSLLIDKSFEAGYVSSYSYVKEVYKGNKSKINDVYQITFNDDTHATWFLLNL